MSDVPLTNEQLAALEIIPGGATFGQAAETMGLSREEIGLPTVRDTPMPINPSFISSRYVGTGKDRVRYDLYSNGERGPFADPEEEDEDTTDTKGESAADREARLVREAEARALARQQTDAFSRLKALLSRVGLTELEGAVQGIITGGQVDLNDANAIVFALRDQPAYQRRFAGNAARAKKGLPELDPSSYVGLEESYRQLMRSNGLPVGFFDQTSDFQQLIEGDVSPSELQERIEQGYRKVRDADPEVKRQMRELYGVDDTALTAYFLDPEKAAPLLTRQARAAQIAARAKEQAAMQLTAQSAEALAARGITPEEAQRAFTERAQLAGLYERMGGEEALTPEEELGATFGYDVQAQQRLARRAQTRVAAFQTGGQFARTSGATSGTVETGLGGPQ